MLINAGRRRAARRSRRGDRSADTPVACVLGGMDIVSPLGAAGIDCVVVVNPSDPSRYSRHVVGVIDALDASTAPGPLVQRLLDWAATQSPPPVLYYPNDETLTVVSRHRDELRKSVRFVIPDRELVEQLADKAAFQQLAERLGLPVPRSVVLPAAAGSAPASALHFPLVLKPVVHRDSSPRLGGAKAVRMDSPAQLEAQWGRLSAGGLSWVAQELVPGPESAVESYHGYVDESGTVVADFAGAKLRTHPAHFGQSSALTVTQRADVLAEGRRLVRSLKFTGVLKADFKRDPAGRLWLFEVNARFNLWHHLGAAAGVNLPALVYADLTGRPRPPATPVRTGVTWCDLPTDRRAMLGEGRSTARWLWFAARSTTRSAANYDDPMPFLRGILAPGVARRAASLSRRRPT